MMCAQRFAFKGKVTMITSVECDFNCDVDLAVDSLADLAVDSLVDFAVDRRAERRCCSA